MKRFIMIVMLVLAPILLIPAVPARSEEAKTTTKDIIMEGLKMLQGYQGGQQTRPDLVVEKIWLDDACQINFRIKNAGGGAIPDAEHAMAMVRIVFGKQFKEFPYGSASAAGEIPVDPGEALKAPGSAVEFNTGIIIDSVMNVSVFADSRGNIKESNENNNSRTQQLNPQCFRQAQTPVVAAQAPLAKPEPLPAAQPAMAAPSPSMAMPEPAPAAQPAMGADLSAPGPGMPVAITAGQMAPSSSTATAATIDMSGQWRSSVGLIYSITQQQNYFQWTVMNSNETGSGTVNGYDVSGSWQGPLGSGSSQGRIVEVDAGGKAARINWENGVKFYR